MNLTRRQLFNELFQGIIGRLSVNIPKINLSKKEEWVFVGSLQDFIPGTRTTVNNKMQIIISSQYGLQANDINSEINRPLKINNTGNIFMNAECIWPNGSWLCPMTGERKIEEEEL